MLCTLHVACVSYLFFAGCHSCEHVQRPQVGLAGSNGDSGATGEQTQRPRMGLVVCTASRWSQMARREKRLQRQDEVVFIAGPKGSVAMPWVRGFLAAYLHTLFVVTLAWVLTHVWADSLDIAVSLFWFIAKVWLYGVVPCILFGYWAVAFALALGFLQLVSYLVSSRWWILLRFAPCPSRWGHALRTVTNWDRFPGWWASLRSSLWAGSYTLRRLAELCLNVRGLLASCLEVACFSWVSSWQLVIQLPIFVAMWTVEYAVIHVTWYYLAAAFRCCVSSEGSRYAPPLVGSWVATHSMNGIRTDKIMRSCINRVDLWTACDTERLYPGGAAFDLIGDRFGVTILLRLLILVAFPLSLTIKGVLIAYRCVSAALERAY